jgi:hypothetical protein
MTERDLGLKEKYLHFLIMPIMVMFEDFDKFMQIKTPKYHE